MKSISIVERPLSDEEQNQINQGFDKLSIEEGVKLVCTEPISFAATSDNQLIGCALGHAHKNGNVYSGWFHLTDLFVVKSHRSQGIGFQLLKSLEEKLISMKIKHIWLWTSGDKSLKFYARHGYKPFVEMEKWYSDGSSRVGLRKDL